MMLTGILPMKFALRMSCCLSFAAFSLLAPGAEEDPSYQPFERVRSETPPRKAVSLGDSPDKNRAPAAPNREPSSYKPATINAYIAPAAAAPVSAAPVSAEPTGPKVKYILNGKPVYEGDPDPLADAKALKATRAGAAVRLDYAAQLPAKSAYGTYGGETPNERKVKYILDGKPVYEGDPDPLADAKARAGVAAHVQNAGDYSAAAALARSQPQNPVSTAPAGLIDDLTADKPAAGNTGDGRLVLEEFVASGPVNSKAKKCYAGIAGLKKNVEAISRFMDNRGKENARLIHASDDVLSDINALAAIWPTSEAFIDVCTVAKRSALVFNNELSQAPWTWTRVRWSYDAMLKDVRALRVYAKNQAESEPKPQMLVGKDGAPIYIDTAEAPTAIVPLAVQRREEAAKLAREQLARIKENNAARAEKKQTKLATDLDGN